MRTKLILLAAVSSLTSLASPAQAGVFFTNATGLTSPASTLTFSEVPLADGTLITTQFAGSGVTFNNAVLNSQDGILPRDYAGNFQMNTQPFSDLLITFGSTVTDAAFQLVTNPGNSTVNVFLGSTLVDSTTFNASAVIGSSASFYGYTNALFDSVRIVAPGSRALLIDNVQFNAAAVGPMPGVPEPATWAMMILGFGVIAAGMRRSRRKVDFALT